MAGKWEFNFFYVFLFAYLFVISTLFCLFCIYILYHLLAVTLTCLHQNGQNLAHKKKKLRATKSVLKLQQMIKWDVFLEHGVYIYLLVGPPLCWASCSNDLHCPSICHMRDRSRLLWNWNRNPGFPIQNLPSDSWSEVQFCHFGCFWVAFSDKLYHKDGTTLGTVAGQLSSRLIMDNTLCFLPVL